MTFFTGICEACGKTPPSLAWKFPQLKKKQKEAKKQQPISEEEEEHKEWGIEDQALKIIILLKWEMMMSATYRVIFLIVHWE